VGDVKYVTISPRFPGSPVIWSTTGAAHNPTTTAVVMPATAQRRDVGIAPLVTMPTRRTTTSDTTAANPTTPTTTA
jgi:hypothetical protein